MYQVDVSSRCIKSSVYQVDVSSHNLYQVDIIRRRMQTNRIIPNQGVFLALYEVWLYEGLLMGCTKDSV
uniref:Uncharacterized protein n=1 Tax=Ditylenchus dipsaci TaxID=166011 RepID=A0A915DNH0_9BILA